MGSEQASFLKFREPWAFIGVKGDSSKKVEMRKQSGQNSTAYVEKEFTMEIDDNIQKGRMITGIKSYLQGTYQDGKEVI